MRCGIYAAIVWLCGLALSMRKATSMPTSIEGRVEIAEVVEGEAFPLSSPLSAAVEESAGWDLEGVERRYIRDDMRSYISQFTSQHNQFTSGKRVLVRYPD